MSIGPVLVVDDNPMVLRLVCDVLACEGYDVIGAATGDECLRLVGARLPALIFMDIQLPTVDGLELTRRIKADPRTRTVPIIALTSHVLPGDRERAFAAGCDAYISKPFDTRTLGKVVAGYAVADQP